MSRSASVSPDQFATFGDLLRYLRRRAGLTQRELSIAVGYSPAQISRLEQNLRAPDPATLLARFASALDIEDEPAILSRLLELAAATRQVDSPPPTAAAHRPHPNLPLQMTPFVGRQDELAEIARLLTRPDCRLLTLVGPGGIGKTRLALEAAAQASPGYSDGVSFVPLAALSSPDFLVSSIAGAIGLSPTGAADPRALLINQVRDKQTLLVLDNFEHLLAGASLLTELLTGAAGLRVLATSRERLNLHGEWLVEVGGLRVPAQEAADDIEGYSAVQLFLQTARRVRPGFALSEADRDSVVRICRLVEGMPLAVEMAAAWARSLSCPDIATEIEGGRDILAASPRDAPERHRFLRAGRARRL